MNLKTKVNFFGWCLFVLFVGFIMFTAMMLGSLARLEHPVTAPNIDVEQSLLSEGWVKECASSVNVSKYRLIDEQTIGCDEKSIDNVPSSELDKIPRDKMVYSYCFSNSGLCGAVYYDCSNESVVPAHVEYYNESICLKFIFVKFNGGGLNG